MWPTYNVTDTPWFEAYCIILATKLIEPKHAEQVYIDDAYISNYQVTKNYG